MRHLKLFENIEFPDSYLSGKKDIALWKEYKNLEDIKTELADYQVISATENNYKKVNDIINNINSKLFRKKDIIINLCLTRNLPNHTAIRLYNNLNFPSTSNISVLNAFVIDRNKHILIVILTDEYFFIKQGNRFFIADGWDGLEEMMWEIITNGRKESIKENVEFPDGNLWRKWEPGERHDIEIIELVVYNRIRSTLDIVVKNFELNYKIEVHGNYTNTLRVDIVEYNHCELHLFIQVINPDYFIIINRNDNNSYIADGFDGLEEILEKLIRDDLIPKKMNILSENIKFPDNKLWFKVGKEDIRNALESSKFINVTKNDFKRLSSILSEEKRKRPDLVMRYNEPGKKYNQVGYTILRFDFPLGTYEVQINALEDEYFIVAFKSPKKDTFFLTDGWDGLEEFLNYIFTSFKRPFRIEDQHTDITFLTESIDFANNELWKRIINSYDEVDEILSEYKAIEISISDYKRLFHVVENIQIPTIGFNKEKSDVKIYIRANDKKIRVYPSLTTKGHSIQKVYEITITFEFNGFTPYNFEMEFLEDEYFYIKAYYKKDIKQYSYIEMRDIYSVSTVSYYYIVDGWDGLEEFLNNAIKNPIDNI